MNIRKANIEDLEAIQELNNDLFKLEQGNYDPNLMVGWPFSEEGAAYFRHAILEEAVLVAEDGEQIIGYLAGRVNFRKSFNINPVSELENIFVMEQYRGRGAGKMLVAEFKKICKEAGAPDILVTASALNVKAIEFYKKAGFSEFEVTLKASV